MKWPGMGDPYKRNKTIKFLIITAIIGISAAAVSTLVQTALNPNDPLKACINDKITNYKIKATLELIIDGEKAEIPANVGNQGECSDEKPGPRTHGGRGTASSGCDDYAR